MEDNRICAFNLSGNIHGGGWLYLAGVFDNKDKLKEHEKFLKSRGCSPYYGSILLSDIMDEAKNNINNPRM